ncbi:nucleotide exchange factor GrpE [Allofranklinella schreckenbergeri]|uniref:Protein GrpE n=1 Tax=Allofranklinella schreckenbergeri TaxID=1076744 RepID=A0A3M6QIP5_9BURK|nr:nucleotide exchange factor GrpE [Allofranklinella schreckenbergeri]RMW96288.1 nucleotide exchange factor GrpE [Allofranklinella schreckenbergeri]RMX02943.1 nucleotide exchange factor GrpE [Allofranklinella schreckenbergeri]RRD42614.1 nucleotide exchange factor GrpE [Comamonadaceae bacterium OH3737_COT-264]
MSASEHNPNPEPIDPIAGIQSIASQGEPLDVNEELAGLYAEVESLKAQAAEAQALQAKNAELADQYLRAKAEADNARRRADEDVAKARKFGIESFAQDLLSVADSLDAALAIDAASAEQLLEGTRAMQNQLLSVFERHKLSPIAPEVGSKFDPNIHQAISAVPSELESGAIVSVLQKGYRIAERVLRPALVMVAA